MNPALVHYKALKHVFAYLANTRTRGIHFWRSTPQTDLPEAPDPLLRAIPQDSLTLPVTIPHPLIAFSDSDWGSDSTHRKSVTGMVILLSGSAILYKTKYQKAVALSTTEAEFTSAADTGKMILYPQSILHELGFSQEAPTPLHVDNTAAVFMIEAQAPTRGHNMLT